MLLIGAGGNLGLRLIARGHHATAFVRGAARFIKRLGALDIAPVPKIEGDAFDRDALVTKISGNVVVVSAAGTPANGAIFADLFASIFDTACRTLPAPRRVWTVAGPPAMTIPHAKVVAAGVQPNTSLRRRQLKRPSKAAVGNRLASHAQAGLCAHLSGR